MDDTPQAVNEAEDTALDTTPVSNEINETEQSNTEEQATHEEVSEKPRRAEKRLHQLLDKYGEPNQEKQAAPVYEDYSGYQTEYYQPNVEPGAEITPEQYKADVARTAQELARLETLKLEKRWQEREESEKKKSTFVSTISQLEKKYPSLNPDREDYNEVLADKVANLYKKASKGSVEPELLKEIVEGVMDLSSQAKTEGERRVTNRLVEQANEQALTPGRGQEEPLSMEKINKLPYKQRVALLEKKLGYAKPD